MNFHNPYKHRLKINENPYKHRVKINENHWTKPLKLWYYVSPQVQFFGIDHFRVNNNSKLVVFWFKIDFYISSLPLYHSKHHLYANSIHLKNNHNKQTQSPKHFAFIYTSLSKHSPLICKHHHSNVFSCFIHIIIPNIVQNNTHLKANSIIQT